MSSSFLEHLGQASIAPPDISDTNYKRTTVDMSKAVNENIDKTQEQIDEHFDWMIKIYNHEHKKQMEGGSDLDKFVGVLTKGKEFYDDDLKPFLEDLKIHNEVTEGWDQWTYKGLQQNIQGGANWESYLNQFPDPDIQAENAATQDRKKLHQASTDAFHETINVDPHIANEMSNGVRDSSGLGIHEKENILVRDIGDAVAYHDTWRERADEKMRHHLGKFADDGTPIYQSLNETTDPLERLEIVQRNNAYYAHKFKHLAKGRLGRWKRELILAMHKKSDLDRKSDIEDFSKAVLQLHLERTGQDLVGQVENNPSYLVDWININRSAYKNPDNSYNYGLVRIAAFNHLIDAVNDGKLERHHIEPILNHMHEFRNSPGKLKSVRNQWPTQTRQLLKALSKMENERANADNENLKGEKQAYKEQFQASKSGRKEAWTYQEVRGFQQDWMYKFGEKDWRNLPEYLKRLHYVGMEEDEEINKRLETKLFKYNRQITEDDIIGLQDYELRKKWLNHIKQGTGLRSGTGAGSSSFATNAIKTVVTAHTEEWDADRKRSPKWDSNFEQATIHYNNVYRNLRENGASEYQAHNEAIASVEKNMAETRKVKIGEKDGQPIYADIPKWDQRGDPDLVAPFNYEGAIQINETVKSISNNRDILKQTSPFKGEKVHLDAAAKYLIRSNQGQSAVIPDYYRTLGNKLKINPHELLIKRLEATGAIKEGDVELLESKNLPLDQQRKLGVNSSASKTYQVTQDNEDYTWMLDTSKSPMAIKNGGYTAIRDGNGTYKNIEEVLGKSLAEITMGDIYNLALGGYTNIGIYDITPQGFVDLIESGELPLDASFDTKDQDLIYLARLRQKANSAKKYSGVDQRYRRLVTLRKEDKDRFTEIAGELPTWLQLDTLLPEVATELIRSKQQ